MFNQLVLSYGLLTFLGIFIVYDMDGPMSYHIQRFAQLFFLLNVWTLWVCRFVFNQPDVLVARTYTMDFVIKYLVCGLMVATLFRLLRKWFHSFEQRAAIEHARWKRLLVVSVFGLSIFLVIFAVWFVEYFGELTPEQFLFNLSSPVKGTAEGANQHIYSTVVLSAIVVTTLFYYAWSHPYMIRIKNKVYTAWEQSFATWKKVILTSTVIVVASLGFVVWELKLVSVANAYFNQSTYIEDNYVDPRNANITFPTKKRNLIHIYLESVENSYFDKDKGGYMEVDLMPELYELAKEGVSFSHNDQKGGPHQVYGTSWSVASMINMGNGIPLKIAMGGNDYGKSGYFLPGVYGIGDLLAENGYEQTIMFGADADFGGLTTYYTSHGDFNIWDVKYARAEGYIPKDYNVWWGFEDDKLYDYAKEEITRLSQTGKPFNFTMETADTHFPDGYLSKNAEKKHDVQYANVISYSSSEVYQFVKWIQAQPFYDNTLVVITGDHLSMDKNFFKQFDPQYERTVYNLFLNSSVTANEVHNRQYATMDYFPTIIAGMGIEFDGERLGLGTNLFSTEKTLIERDGLKAFNDEISKNSNFYNEQFVDEKNATR